MQKLRSPRGEKFPPRGRRDGPGRRNTAAGGEYRGRTPAGSAPAPGDDKDDGEDEEPAADTDSAGAAEGDLVIAAHNYESHFGTLKTLVGGEDVIFADADGNVWYYTVAEVETLQPTAIEEMTQSGYPLTLFTCTYGGAARVTVRGEAAEK